MKPTPFQERVLEVPEEYNLALLGGRGGGKTISIILLVVRHVAQHGSRARPLIIRETLASLRELEDEMDRLLARAFPGTRSNRQEHQWKIPGGAIVETGYLAEPADFDRYQGKSYSLIVGEEAGNYRTLKWIDMLRGNLRVSGIPCRFVLSANPGGRQHTQIQQRHASKVPWVPYEDAFGERWVHAPSLYKDNPHLPADYRTKLRAATGSDKELLRAWESGDWNISRGAFFAGRIDESKQKLSSSGLPEDLHDGRKFIVPELALPWRGAETFVSADWGQSRPAVAFACARLLQPAHPYPRGSLILLDEVSSADPDDLAVGLNWSPGKFADSINEMCKRTRCAREGVIDDARGLAPDQTLIGLMSGHQLEFRKPAKGRSEGWAALGELMFNSYEKNGRPGLWVSERCTGFWTTLPVLPRDPLRPEDVDSAAVDHWADAARYAATRETRIARISHVAY